MATVNKLGAIQIRHPTTGFIRQLLWHADASCVAIDHTSSLLASGASDGSIRVWHVPSGQQLSVLRGQDEPVYSLAFSPTQSVLAVGTHNRELQLLDFDAGQILTVFDGHGDLVRSVGFSPDGKYVVTGCDDMLVRVVEVSTGKLMRTLRGHSGLIRDVVYFPDGQRVASCGSDLSVRIWDLKSGKATSVMKEHKNIVWNLACSPDGRGLVSAGFDGAIRKWNPDTGKLMQKVRDQQGAVLGLSYSPDGESIVASLTSGQLSRWRAEVPPSHIKQTDLAAFRPGLDKPGIRPVEWEDGAFESSEISNVKTVKALGAQLYFEVDDRFCAEVPEDTDDRYIITAQVYDRGKGHVLIQYDGHPRPGQTDFGSQWVSTEKVNTTGRKDWITVTFELARPRLANRQQGKADFRFVGTSRNKPEIRRVELRRIRKQSQESTSDD